MSRPRWIDAGETAVRIASQAQMLRFVLVGLLNTAFGYGAFVTCLAIGLPVPVALVLSTVAGVLFNFQTSRRLVFRSSLAGRLPRFVALYACILVLNGAAIALLERVGVAAWAAQAGLVVPLAFMTFAAQRCFVFRSDRP